MMDILHDETNYYVLYQLSFHLYAAYVGGLHNLIILMYGHR